MRAGTSKTGIAWQSVVEGLDTRGHTVVLLLRSSFGVRQHIGYRHGRIDQHHARTSIDSLMVQVR